MSSSFDPTFITGPLLVGWLMHWGLFGVSTVQLYIYYMSFPRDSRYMKALVYGIYGIEVLLIALNTEYANHMLGKGWGDPTVLIVPTWTFSCTAPITGLVSASVQSFFSWRIWILSESPYLPILYSLIGVTSFVFATITGVGFQVLDDYRKIPQLRRFVLVWLIGGAVCDVAITSTLIFYLSRKRRGTFKQTEDIVNRLIRLTIETGLITAVAAVIEVILLLTEPSNNLHLAVFLILAKIYSNSLMATLNARSSLFANGRHYTKPTAATANVTHASQSMSGEHHASRYGPSAVRSGGGGGMSGVQVSRVFDVRGDDAYPQRMEMLSLPKDHEPSLDGFDAKAGQHDFDRV